MRLIRLTIINMKRNIKNPLMLLMSLVMPIIVLFGMFSPYSSSSHSRIGIINNDTSKYSSDLVEKLEEKYKIEHFEGKVEDSFDNLRDNKVGAIYVIESDFEKLLKQGEAPEVKCYKVEDTKGTIMVDDIINSHVNSILQEGVNKGLSDNYVETMIKDDGIDDKNDYIIVLMMISYFMMIGGSIITEDIIRLKTQKVLKRTIATGNSDKEILGGLFLSIFILQAFLSSLAFVISTKFLNVGNYDVGNAIYVLTLSSLISTSVVVVVTRWVKNSTLANLATVVFGLITFGIAMLGMAMNAFENIPGIITKLSLVSPFYWLIEIAMNGKILVPTIIIILMSAVFFTAGSFKLREFVKE